MSKGITFKAKLNKGSVENKIWPIFDIGTNLDVAQKFVDIVNPYVPYDTGALSKDVVLSTSASSGNVEITYTAEYAAKQYYGEEFHHKTEIHPLATAHWDKVAMQTERERFAKEAEQIVKDKAKKVKG